MAKVFDEANQYFEASLDHTHADYERGLPGPAPIFAKINDSSGFIQRKWLDVKKRYQRPLHEYVESCQLFIDRFNTVTNAFDPLLTDYDKQIVLPTTCGLGFIKPTHTDFDARGNYDEGGNFRYPTALIDAVVKFYSSHIVKRGDATKITLPRGKNSGWPHPISGRMREVTDILLGLNVGLGIAGKRVGWRLSELTRFLEGYHGPAMLIPGERYQHTTRTMPAILAEGTYYSKNLEVRVRTILMSGKYAVAWNKPFVNSVLENLLHNPMHTQKRTDIRKRIADAQGRGWHLYAVDAKRFDGRHGGKRGDQIMLAISKAFGNAANYQDLTHEFALPVLAFDSKGAYLSRNSGEALMLPSGVSSTTIVNCVGNCVISAGVYSLITKRSYADTMASYQKDWDFLAWGDDGLLMSPLEIPEAELSAAYTKFDFSAEFEPTVKFLGSNYAKGTFSGTMDIGYSMGRAVQQQFFPERVKLYPFSAVGYIARLELMGPTKAREFHMSMYKMWDVEKMGPLFKYEDRVATLHSLLPLIEKHADKISSVDDVLQVLTHGIDDADLGLDSELEMFSEFLGLTQVDVTDPIEMLHKQGVDEYLINKIAKLVKGDFSQYSHILSDLARLYSLTLRSGQPLY